MARVPRSPGFIPVPASSDPDSVTTYELGWKVSVPEVRAVFNGAIYHSDWKDMQVQSWSSVFDTTNAPPGAFPMDSLWPTFMNATRARIDGLEIEVSIELLAGLQARASFAYIDAQLAEDFPLYNLAGHLEMHGLKGDRIPFVARTSGSAGLSYRRPLLGRFTGFVDLNAQYQGSRATDFNRLLNSSPQDGGISQVPMTTYYLLDAYWTTGMQIGVQRAQWRTALTFDNLFNDRADLFHSGDSRVTNRPRTVGLLFRYNFD
jgi:iron complex outermembrane recepter protein